MTPEQIEECRKWYSSYLLYVRNITLNEYFNTTPETKQKYGKEWKEWRETPVPQKQYKFINRKDNALL